MPKRSNDFQKLVFLVKQQLANDALVTESKFFQDRFTGTNREVDICIEKSVGGHLTIICIECRDHKRKADVKWVEEMKGKHENLQTNLLVLVSKKGFTTEAKEKAKFWGFETLALEDVDSESINRLFGGIDLAWTKLYTLKPLQITAKVSETNFLPGEEVYIVPENYIYLKDGTIIGMVKDLIDVWLQPGELVNDILPMADGSHKNFSVYADKFLDKSGNLLCLKNSDSEQLRSIESITVFGECEFHVSEFPLDHGVLGNTRISWGKGEFMSDKAILVASEDEVGTKNISLTLSN